VTWRPIGCTSSILTAPNRAVSDNRAIIERLRRRSRQAASGRRIAQHGRGEPDAGISAPARCDRQRGSDPSGTDRLGLRRRPAIDVRRIAAAACPDAMESGEVSSSPTCLTWVMPRCDTRARRRDPASGSRGRLLPIRATELDAFCRRSRSMMRDCRDCPLWRRQDRRRAPNRRHVTVFSSKASGPVPVALSRPKSRAVSAPQCPLEIDGGMRAEWLCTVAGPRTKQPTEETVMHVGL